jgi:carboxypeptidase Q
MWAASNSCAAAIVFAAAALSTADAQPSVLPADIAAAVDATAPDIATVVDALTAGRFKGETWARLARFTDTIGNRLAGSPSFEAGADYLLDFFRDEGFRGTGAGSDRVYTEAAMVPHWVRGEERATLLSPTLSAGRQYELHMLGLGGSIGTAGQPAADPRTGAITADVVVFGSILDMQSRAAEVRGKIVLINDHWEGYNSGIARVPANVEAFRLGAVAALIRSVAPYSIQSPHTGSTGTLPGQVSSAIPTAALSVEDAAMLARMAGRGYALTVELYMEASYDVPGNPGVPCATDQCSPSRNVILELAGSAQPDEVVLLSGHLDSWDVGFGAMDDGGGVFISLEVCSSLKRLGIRPRRTIRCVGWTSEEMGSQGSRQYWQDHAGELGSFSAVFEVSRMMTTQP